MIVYNRNDSIIQQVLHEEFSDCTVLTVAHCLDTVIDSDLYIHCYVTDMSIGIE